MLGVNGLEFPGRGRIYKSIFRNDGPFCRPRCLIWVTVVILSALSDASAQDSISSNDRDHEGRLIHSVVRELADSICTGLSGDLNKVSAIRRWIITNITYEDTNEAKDKYYNFIVNPLYAAMFRETNCYGYSSLFSQICHLCGVKAYTVSGYVYPEEDPDYIVGNTFVAMSHAWNVVQIDNEWHHTDLTWDSDAYHTGDGEIEFLIETKDLLRDRMPGSPMFQLVPNPMPLSRFVNDSLFDLHDFANGNYFFKDTLDTYSKMPVIDRTVFLGRQYTEFNHVASSYYAIALFGKAMVLFHNHKMNTKEKGKELEIAYQYISQALFYMQQKFDLTDGLNGKVKTYSGIRKGSIRDARRLHRRIERRLKYS